MKTVIEFDLDKEKDRRLYELYQDVPKIINALVALVQHDRELIKVYIDLDGKTSTRVVDLKYLDAYGVKCLGNGNLSDNLGAFVNAEDVTWLYLHEII